MRYPDEYLLSRLKENASNYGIHNLFRKMRLNKVRPCVQTYKNRFGSWRNTLIKAGISQVNAIGRRYESNVRKMSNTEAMYIAGLIDCEGCISMAGRGSSNYMIDFSNNNYELVKKVREIVNGGKVYQGGELTWRIRFRKNETAQLLPQIFPYLIVKKRRAEYLLGYIEREHSVLDFKEQCKVTNISTKEN